MRDSEGSNTWITPSGSRPTPKGASNSPGPEPALPRVPETTPSGSTVTGEEVQDNQVSLRG